MYINANCAHHGAGPPLPSCQPRRAHGQRQRDLHGVNQFEVVHCQLSGACPACS